MLVYVQWSIIWDKINEVKIRARQMSIAYLQIVVTFTLTESMHFRLFVCKLRAN